MESEAGPSCQAQAASGDLSGHNILAIPVEITLKIFGNLDLQSAFSLAGTNKNFKRIFDVHGETLILSILETELSPFDNLLQYIVSGPGDLSVQWGPCLRRRIYHRGRLISEGETPEPGQQAHDLLFPATLDQLHFQDLIRTYRTVKEWEQCFPQYRFRDCPSDCRALRPHEAERLRGALYHWMAYARYFHGDYARPNRFVPEEGSTDIRCKKLRILSNVELCELNDLWQTVVSMVQLHICPSTEQVMMENDGNISLREAENLSFGSSSLALGRSSWNDARYLNFDSNINRAIVDTFLKLSPDDVLRFAANRFAYSRDRIVREVQLAYPSILEDRQSLGHALAAVLAERQPAAYITEHYGQNYGALFKSQGGVLDYDAADGMFRRAMDAFDPRQKALDWAVDERPDLGVRIPTYMDRGRLEP